MTDPPKPCRVYKDLYLCDPDKSPCKCSMSCGNECFATFNKEAALCDVYGRPILIASKEQQEAYDQDGILTEDMFDMWLSAAILRYSMGNPLSERLKNKMESLSIKGDALK